MARQVFAVSNIALRTSSDGCTGIKYRMGSGAGQERTVSSIPLGIIADKYSDKIYAGISYPATDYTFTVTNESDSIITINNIVYHFNQAEDIINALMNVYEAVDSVQDIDSGGLI
jgi:hypothetical protein